MDSKNILKTRLIELLIAMAHVVAFGVLALMTVGLYQINNLFISIPLFSIFFIIQLYMVVSISRVKRALYAKPDKADNTQPLITVNNERVQ